MLSSDGLATGASADLTREDSEHLAAVASGFHSLAKGVGHHFDAGRVRQTVVELDEAFLFVHGCIPAPRTATPRSATPTPTGPACPSTTMRSAASSTATSVYGVQGTSGSLTYGGGGP
ncbi:hypothetical protein SBADM41S_00471 [Streptomyces badius]